MTPQIDHKILLKLKRYLDNGFTGPQSVEKLGVSLSVVSRLRKGHYGVFPTFPEDPELKAELGQMNLEKMRSKLSKRKDPKKR